MKQPFFTRSRRWLPLLFALLFGMQKATAAAEFTVQFVGCDSVSVSLNLPPQPGLNYAWDFGNGTIKTGPGPVGCRYLQPGNFTVKLTITGPSLQVISDVSVVQHCAACYQTWSCDIAGTANQNPELFLRFQNPASGFWQSTPLVDEAQTPVHFTELNGLPTFLADIPLEAWDNDNTPILCWTADFLGQITIPKNSGSATFLGSPDLVISISTQPTANYVVSENIVIQPSPAPPTIAANGPTVLCPGQCVTLTANKNGCPNCTVIWSNGMTGDSIMVSQTGNFTATTSGGGCVSGSSNAISVFALPSDPLKIACQNDTIQCTNANLIPADIEWLDKNMVVATGKTFVPPAAGEYEVRYQGGTCPRKTRFLFESVCQIIILEICQNGIDDDSDGLLDCADPDCSMAAIATNSGPYYSTQTIELSLEILSGEAVSFQWSGPNGFSSSLASPVIPNAAPLQAGLYFATVTSSCGSSAVIFTDVYVSPNLPPVPPAIELLVGSAKGSPGSQILLPILKIWGCDTLTGLTGKIAVADAAVAEIVGWQAGKIPLNSFSTASGQFVFFTGSGAATANGDTLFFIKINLKGIVGDSSPVFIDPATIKVTCPATGLAEQPGISQAGELTIIPGKKVVVFLKTGLGSPVGKAVVVMTGNEASGLPLTPVSKATAADGMAIFDNLPAGATLHFGVFKNINEANGIGLGDLVGLMQWLVGNTQNVQTCYQIIAANANCDDQTGLDDLDLLDQVWNGLASFPCESWVFVPAGYQFATPPTPFSAKNQFNPAFPTTVDFLNLTTDTACTFIGIKIGDVNQSADPQNLLGTGTDGPAANTLHLTTTTIETGDEVAVQIRASNFNDIAAIGLNLHFNPQDWAFVYAVGSQWNARFEKLQEGRLPILWLSGDGKGRSKPADEVLLTIHFQKKTTTATTAQPILFLEKDTEPNGSATEKNGLIEEQSVSLEPAETTSAAGPNAGFDTFQFFAPVPNPASDETAIRFQLPEPAEVELAVFNLFGQPIWRKTGRFAAGLNQISLSLADFEPGLVVCILQTGGHSATQKLLIQR